MWLFIHAGIQVNPIHFSKKAPGDNNILCGDNINANFLFRDAKHHLANLVISYLIYYFSTNHAAPHLSRRVGSGSMSSVCCALSREW